jgi:hypothetical protein
LALPPLLEEHINFLISQGYKIEIKEEQAICITIRDYPIPGNIWNRDKVDLLVIAHPTYPNAKMDMFWVDPPVALKNGTQAQAVSQDTQCGKTWQRFSWHLSTWNPNRDNLITYLHDIDNRLNKAN